MEPAATLRKAEAGRSITLTHRAVAALLGVFTVVLLLVTTPTIGLTWDEPAYIAASESYIRWFGDAITKPSSAFSDYGIKQAWEINHEHPPLDKGWSGAIWMVGRFVFDDLAAHRLGNMLLVGGLVGLLYLMVGPSYGRMAGIAAVGALLCLPRFFFHAHLAALDVPTAATSFGVVYLFWYSHRQPGLRWILWLGLAWGLALATKFNAIFVLPTLGLWMLMFQRRLQLFIRLVMMIIIGIPLSLVLWPWLYHHSMSRLIEYVAFITYKHWQISQWYLGRSYLPPPWHFPLVMLLAVVPVTLLLLSIIGLVRVAARDRSERPGWLFVFGAAFSILALSTGKSVVYDNERLMMAAFPHLAALAGLGFWWLVEGLRTVTSRRQHPFLPTTSVWLVAAVAFAPPVLSTIPLYPHLLSYYSTTVGGLTGATHIGLETTYWCETYRDAIPYLNQHAPPGAIIWIENYSHDVLLYYQLHGELRRDLRITSPPGAESSFNRQGMKTYPAAINQADFVLLEYRQGGINDQMKQWLTGRVPVYRLSYQGIPLMEVYRAEKLSTAAVSASEASTTLMRR